MAVKIGLVGTGTVGGGCIDIIQKHKDDFLRHFGVDIELARVCSLSSAEAEAHGVGHLFTDNFNNIINDPGRLGHRHRHRAHRRHHHRAHGRIERARCR